MNDVRYIFLLIACFACCFVGCDEWDGTPTDNQKETTKPTDPNRSPTVPGTTRKNGTYPPSHSFIGSVKPTSFNNTWSQTTPGAPSQTTLKAYLKRKARRMSVSKIENTIKSMLNTTWTQTINGKQVDMFQNLSLTLGRADYKELTKSNDEVTKLFMKLMDDMAANVCPKAVANDLKAGTPMNKRNFVRDPNNVDNTLRFIRLTFHGVFIAPGNTSNISALKTLYNKAIQHKNGSRQKAWELICIATLTSPEFYIY